MHFCRDWRLNTANKTVAPALVAGIDRLRRCPPAATSVKLEVLKTLDRFSNEVEVNAGNLTAWMEGL
jgi:hypothetical protein